MAQGDLTQGVESSSLNALEKSQKRSHKRHADLKVKRRTQAEILQQEADKFLRHAAATSTELVHDAPNTPARGVDHEVAQNGSQRTVMDSITHPANSSTTPNVRFAERFDATRIVRSSEKKKGRSGW